jgi:formylglycine-generating enzyme
MRKLSRLLLLYLAVFIFTLSCGKDSKNSGPTGPGDDIPQYIELTFVSIPGGTFRMGDIQGDGEPNELPVHDVTLSGFEMSIYEVTNAQYASYLTKAIASGDITASGFTVVGASGDWSCRVYIDIDDYECDIAFSGGIFKVINNRENNPVNNVSWYGAKAFAEYYDLDLPREAEWEYACRAGSETYFYTGNNLSRDVMTSTDLDRAGWYYANNDSWECLAVGQKEPNVWGLYDMHGNVWEWCYDRYDESYYASSKPRNPYGPESGSGRVVRGGCYGDTAWYCRSSVRTNYKHTVTSDSVGFRVVRRPSGVSN